MQGPLGSAIPIWCDPKCVWPRTKCEKASQARSSLQPGVGQAQSTEPRDWTSHHPRSRPGLVSSLVQTLTFSHRTSCLLSPLTYEGLLDETFGISCGTVEFPPEVTKTETATKLQLSCKDKMFDKIRNKHFATIFSVLGVTAKQLAAAQVLEK